MKSASPARSLTLLATCAVSALVATGAGRALADDTSTGRIGPALSTTANGRHLQPAGRLTGLGNFPTGSALSPDGRFLWVVDAGHGVDDVQILRVADGAVVQKLPLPGGYVGVAFSPDGSRAYVSGEPKRDVNSSVDKPGTSTGGDVVHVFSVSTSSGQATEGSPIALPATTGGTAQQHAAAGPISGTPGTGPSSKGLGWPIGLAVSPDGSKLVVALNQADQVAVVDTASRSAKLVKVGAYPYGVAIDPDGHRALVTNELDGTVSVVELAGGNVTATISGLGGQRGDKESHPEGIVIDPQRPRAYVAVANRDAVAVLDTRTLRVTKLVSVARGENLGVQPVALALTPDGETLYAADSGEDALAQIALTSRSLPAGAPPAVPGGGALPPGVSPLRHGRSRFVFRVPSLHRLGRYRVLARRARRTLHARHGRRQAAARYRNILAGLRRGFLQPVAVRACGGPSLAKARRYVLRALNALAHRGTVRRRLLRRARRLLPHIRRCAAAASAASSGRSIPAYSLVGRIPTAAYPADVQVTPSGDRLLWVAAKGLGAGPNPAYGSGSLADSNAASYGTYVLDLLLGRAGVLERPDDADAVALTPYADAQARPANAPAAPPAGTALRGGGPIKHVFYVVRENRTYDQVFGSENRGDGDPKLELFDDNGVPGPTGGVTPNAHALARRFPLLDHLYADSEVSIDGHIITAGAVGIDYVQKAVAPSYSNRGRISEFGDYPITFGPNDFIFDQAARQNVTFRNYGESSIGNQPGGNDGRPTFATVGANTQYAYPFVFGCAGSPVPAPAPSSLRCNTDSGQTPPSPATSRFDFFRSQFAGASDATWPAFTYLTLPNDHTNGTKAGLPTPRALVADNDRGLGQLVDAISHSSIWQSSAIFVVEDDSQDGADHVDAHRMPAFVISPWTRTGAVVHTAYDQNSALHSAEILLGLKPLSLLDATATPMYDAFTRDGSHDDSPYNAITPTVPLTETNRARAPDAALSSALPFDHLDVVPQALSDRILWHSVHGAGSSPPAPGPGASPAEHGRAVDALRLYHRRGDIRKFLLHAEP